MRNDMGVVLLINIGGKMLEAVHVHDAQKTMHDEEILAHYKSPLLISSRL